MILNDLKARIERIEGRTKRFVAADALPYDACHDFTPLVKTDVPQVAGFIFALLQRLPIKRRRYRPIIWCQTSFNSREYGRVYAPGLLGSSLSPEDFIFVNVPKERDLALVLEECVRVPHIAAQESHVPCLILNTGGGSVPRLPPPAGALRQLPGRPTRSTLPNPALPPGPLRSPAPVVATRYSTPPSQAP